MTWNLVKGKALLVVEREDSNIIPITIHPFVQHATGGDYAIDCAHEDLQYAGIHDLPKAVDRLKPGERARVAVTFEIFYSTDYWGECDFEITFTKAKVLRIQRAPKYYIEKKRRR